MTSKRVELFPIPRNGRNDVNMNVKYERVMYGITCFISSLFAMRILSTQISCRDRTAIFDKAAHGGMYSPLVSERIVEC